MKNKLDWFDDNWNWDVLPTRMLYELLLSPTYRWPWKVKIVCSYRWGAESPKCTRCGTTMEREYNSSATVAGSDCTGVVLMM